MHRIDSTLMEKKKKKIGKTTKEHNIKISVWHTSRVITSNVPRQRPNCPRTPASSRTSRRAVTAGSSSGSTPPPGTIQLSGLRLDVTSSTCNVTVRVRDRRGDVQTCLLLTPTRQLQLDQRSEKRKLGSWGWRRGEGARSIFREKSFY